LRAFAAIGIIALLLLSGCVGNRNISECKVPTMRDSEKVPCYHQAAVSEAYAEHDNDAQSICASIMSDIGNAHTQDDLGKKAEVEQNLCYFDIARIIARHPGMGQFAYNLCTNIRQNSYQTALAGAEATQDSCKEDVFKMSQITPENYYTNGKDNICTVILALPPLLMLAALLYRKN